MTAAALSRAHDAVDGCRARRDVRVARASPASSPKGDVARRYRLGPVLSHADHAARAGRDRPQRRRLHRRVRSEARARLARLAVDRRHRRHARPPLPHHRHARPHPRQDRLAVDGDRALRRARRRSDAPARVLDRHQRRLARSRRATSARPTSSWSACSRKYIAKTTKTACPSCRRVAQPARRRRARGDGARARLRVRSRAAAETGRAAPAAPPEAVARRDRAAHAAPSRAS